MFGRATIRLGIGPHSSILLTLLAAFRCVLVTVTHKKRDILFLTITLANLNRFL